MIIKQQGWDVNPFIKTMKEYVETDLFEKRVSPTIFIGRKEDIPVERIKVDTERIVLIWMQGMKELDEQHRYFYEDCDIRSTYIFTVDFLKTGGTLVSLIIKFRGVLDPVRIDAIY